VYGLSTFLSARYPTGSRRNAIRLHGNRKYRKVKYRSGEGADTAVESNDNSRRSHCKSKFASRVHLTSVAGPGFSPPTVPGSSSDPVPSGSGEGVDVDGAPSDQQRIRARMAKSWGSRCFSAEQALTAKMGNNFVSIVRVIVHAVVELSTKSEVRIDDMSGCAAKMDACCGKSGSVV